MSDDPKPGETSPAAPAAFPNAHVLVVDDEQSIRHFVRCALADAGYHVSEAATGQEALRVFRGEGPDLVVLDVCLPDADGLDLLAQLKSESPDTPVIIITALADVKKAVE